jgi:hypothetical protein
MLFAVTVGRHGILCQAGTNVRKFYGRQRATKSVKAASSVGDILYASSFWYKDTPF